VFPKKQSGLLGKILYVNRMSTKQRLISLQHQLRFLPCDCMQCNARYCCHNSVYHTRVLWQN